MTPLISFIVFAVFLCHPACAQTPESTGPKGETASTTFQLSPMVVTAQRVEQSSQEVPISLSTLNQQQIDDIDITGSEGLVEYIPNVHFANFGSQIYSPLVVRGIGASVLADPSVGLYVDGAYYPARFQDIELLDLERVELLRGPQGTLFGRNTLAGALQLITRKPTDEVAAEVRGTIGNRDLFKSLVRLSGPLLPGKLYGSFAGRFEQRDGFVDYTLLNGTGEDIENSLVEESCTICPTMPSKSWRLLT